MYRWLIAALVLMGVQAQADQGLLACRDTPDSLERLRCYDALTDARYPRTDDDSAQSAGESRVISETKPAIDADSFGKREELRRESEAITAMVSELTTSPAGKLVLNLDNDQVWVQIDSSRIRLREGDAVSIRTSSLNSFQLRKADGGKSIRVRRIR